MKIIKLNGTKIEDFNWAREPVIGKELLLNGGQIDSFKTPINAKKYYKIGKHRVHEKVLIIPTNINERHKYINDLMKKVGRFN